MAEVYEEIEMKSGFGADFSQSIMDYGYSKSDDNKIWEHPANNEIRKKRGLPMYLIPGDKIIIPLPWKIIKDGFDSAYTRDFSAVRSGGEGKYLRWVQTIFEDKMRLRSSASYPYLVDGYDDDEPFYWNSNDVSGIASFRRNNFHDAPYRFIGGRKSASAWRATLSICSVCEKRVSIFDSIVWGLDFLKDGSYKQVQPRKASPTEIENHLLVLQNGSGKTQTFKSGGWTFRKAPAL